MSVPSGWLVVPVGELFKVVGGGTPSTVVAEYWAGNVPWISSADIDESHNVEIRRFITDAAIANSTTNAVPAGSVIVVTRVGLGKVAIAPREMCFSQDSQALTFDAANFNTRYVLTYMSTAVRVFRQISRGTTISGVTKKQLAELPFRLPPRLEQDRIVGEIDKQMTRLDAAVAALRRVQANLKRYRASVLKAACEGRLVPTEAELARKEGRTYEPASELLKRILQERRAKWEAAQLTRILASGKPPQDDSWKKKYKEPDPPDPSELPPVPSGWTWATAEQLSDESRSITYGVIKLGRDHAGGVKTLRSSDVRHLSLDLEHVKQIDPLIAANYKRTFLEGAEILVTVRGTLGGVVVAPDTCRGFNVSREVAVVALIGPKLAPAVSIFIASPLCQTWLMQNTSGVAYTGVNIERLKALPVPLAPESEMIRIHAAVEAQLSACDCVASQSEIGLKRSMRLRESILKCAFEGKLVPQDPNDEPASVLLERIRAERTDTKTSKKYQRIPRGIKAAAGEAI